MLVKRCMFCGDAFFSDTFIANDMETFEFKLYSNYIFYTTSRNNVPDVNAEGCCIMHRMFEYIFLKCNKRNIIVNYIFAIEERTACSFATYNINKGYLI